MSSLVYDRNYFPVLLYFVIIGLNLFLKQADLIDFLEQYVKTTRDCGELCTVLQWDKQQRTHNVVGKFCLVIS